MMRLFRGKQIKSGQWVYFNHYGIYCDNDGNELEPKKFIRDYDCKIIEETEGEYTGLKDKNGKKIYEGDIVSMGDSNVPTLVFWNDNECAFNFKNIRRNEIHHINKHSLRFLKEVIGNVYDNTELLEKQS